MPKRDGLWPEMTALVERFFVRHRKKLAYVHVAMFVAFLLLLAIPLFLQDPPEHAKIWQHFTVFARFAVWTVWFPLVFLSVIFTGRSWCGVLCPMGAASEWANKVGFKRAIPRWVQWEGTPVVSFLIVTIWGQLVGVRDHPEAMALVFGTALLAAVLLGLFYGRNKRAWCRHMCPIGLLLGVFSRLGAVQFMPKKPLAGGDRFTEKTACPTMISLRHKAESRHCIECFKCVSPQTKGGLYLKLRKPGEEIIEIHEHNPNLAEVLFMFLGTGVSLGGFLWLILPSYQGLRQKFGEWALDHGLWLLSAGPSWLVSVHPARREVFLWLDFFTITGYMLFWSLAMTTLLSAVTALASWVILKNGGNRSFRASFTELGYQYIPVAMLSLLLGLGGDLFHLLGGVGVSKAGVAGIKATLFVGSLVWSLYLGNKIIRRQGAKSSWLPLLIGAIGSVSVGLAWWPAVFGL